jgi:GT2 family glycosyltransferase
VEQAQMTNPGIVVSNPTEPAEPVLDVVIIVVAFHSEGDLPGLLDSLPAAAAGLAHSVIVVDNDAGSSSVAGLVADRANVSVVDAGGNLGFSGGLNVGLEQAPRAEAILFLNPDLVLDAGSVRVLLEACREAGAAVPLVRDASGVRQQSLRREPSLTGALGDALFGDRWPGRPARLSETMRHPRSYTHSHDVDWATGAALMVQSSLVQRVGEWDAGRFFLYSEETDYCRRIRATGATIRFCPHAGASHVGGGSGSSADLDALLLVNKVRYFHKWHHGSAGQAVSASGFWAVGVLHGLLRPHNPGARRATRALLSARSRAALPGPTRATALTDPPQTAEGVGLASEVVPAAASSRGGSVILAAFNEEAVIGRALTALGDLSTAGIRVIVACNGCTDDTAEIARRFAGVTVVELDQASKTLALRAGDLLAGPGPRIYLDADVVMSARAVLDTVAVLSTGVARAARPPVYFDSSGAGWPMRRWYAVRSELPSIAGKLWGAGVYALSEAGRARFGVFPELVSDDAFIDALFDVDETTIVPTDPVRVRTPRTTADLMKIMRRSYRTQSEVAAKTGRSALSHSQRDQVSDLIALLRRRPAALFDVVIYVLIVARARFAALRGRYTTWERDDSSRS